MINSKNLTIAIVDSGIGGVSVLKQLINKYKSGNYIYFADNQHMPYGSKSSKWLKARLNYILNLLFNKYYVDMVIIACNTASTVISPEPKIITMQFYKEYTYLATKLTKKNLLDFDIIADSNLAKQIEKNILNKNKIKQIAFNHIRKYKLYNYKELVLGCTHYELIKKEFQKFCPNTEFINNSSFIIDKIALPIKTNELNIKIELTKQNLALENKINKLIRS